mmetsp:Transcript_155341/g.498397  ORF Transcript_155341/g.498397 Transcript_155341/m.498397 type:complete len:123 (+) Transcript_155341:79-447(+)
MSSFSLVASLAVCGWGYRLPFVTKDKYAAFDDALAIDADQSVGVEVAIGQVSVNESPLFNADRGWEFRLEAGYPSVVYDPADTPPFKMWYNSFVSCMWRPQICSPDRDATALLYAHSEASTT